MAKNIGSTQAFQDLINQPDSVVAVDFWAPWCGPCRNFAPIFDEASTIVGDAAEFVKVNVDDHKEIAQQHDNDRAAVGNGPGKERKKGVHACFLSLSRETRRGPSELRATRDITAAATWIDDES